MSDSPADRPDPLRAWLAATSGDQPGSPPPPGGGTLEPRASRRLVTVTALVCAAAVALGFAARVRTDRPPAAAPTQIPAATLAATPTPASAPAMSALSEPVDAAVAATALLAVRTGVGAATYVDTAAVEAASVLDGAVLVTVRALVLRRAATGWSQPETVRYAVPVSPVDTGAALGAPWRLPADVPAGPPPQWRSVGDDAALLGRATDALAAAGYARVTGLRLHRAPDLPAVLRASVRAVAPGDAAAAEHELWLAEDASTVLGLPAVSSLPVPGEQP